MTEPLHESATYEAPRIEKVLTPADLESEVMHGIILITPIP